MIGYSHGNTVNNRDAVFLLTCGNKEHGSDSLSVYKFLEHSPFPQNSSDAAHIQPF